MSLVVSQKTALMTNYLFFLLGLIVGVIERGSPLVWACIGGATLGLVVMLVRTSRLERTVSTRVQQERTRGKL